MRFFLVKHEGGVYANRDICIAALAGGEKAFMKMLADKEVVCVSIFDQALYLLNDKQVKECMEYSPTVQDFEGFFKHLNVLSEETIELIKKADSFLPNAALVKVNAKMAPDQYKYRQVSFFKVSAFKENKKYRMLVKMAAVKICGFLYVALNAVDVRIENPVIATLDK